MTPETIVWLIIAVPFIYAAREVISRSRLPPEQRCEHDFAELYRILRRTPGGRRRYTGKQQRSFYRRVLIKEKGHDPKIVDRVLGKVTCKDPPKMKP